MSDIKQFGRKASLMLVQGEKALDLSELRFTFQTAQQDAESPSTCVIRVYNLSDDTIRKVKGEYSRVVVQAGYEGAFGVVFDGDIRQYRTGRENATDRYLDILAADGGAAYVNATVNVTLAAGATMEDQVDAAMASMQAYGVKPGYVSPLSSTGGVLPRGKVMFGMARAALRQIARSRLMTWTINGGRVNMVALDSYLPGEAVVLNAQTGMVGLPEQTEDGIRVRSLLNPKLIVGGLVRIDNRSINQLSQSNPGAAPVPYNRYAGVQNFATVTNDGFYRLFVVEHKGDTKGAEWYSDLICLAISTDTKKVRAQ